MSFSFLVIVHVLTRKFRDERSFAKLRNVLWLRYTDKKYDVLDHEAEMQEEIDTSLDRIVDRHINKARGILPFNSILLAVFAFERDHLARRGAERSGWRSARLGALGDPKEMNCRREACYLQWP